MIIGGELTDDKTETNSTHVDVDCDDFDGQFAPDFLLKSVQDQTRTRLHVEVATKTEIYRELGLVRCSSAV